MFLCAEHLFKFGVAKILWSRTYSKDTKTNHNYPGNPSEKFLAASVLSFLSTSCAAVEFLTIVVAHHVLYCFFRDFALPLVLLCCTNYSLMWFSQRPLPQPLQIGVINALQLHQRTL